ncbi:MAG: phenylalanine--tRNA ligase subunit beta, partial [Spirochaetia bacterium]|nr:phenylalanine--tRNA ligase subunit beta [Spirochaetia bacterium]
MKLSWNWLNDYVDLSTVKVDDVVQRLTMTTCEIEGYERVFSHLEHVVAGLVVKKEKHPGADRLSVCTVQAGAETLQIVCGAPNVREGMAVAVARIGAKLPSAKAAESGGILEIKRSAIRGVESFGMLCSSDELGLVPLFGVTEGLIDLAVTGIGQNQLGGGKSLSRLLGLSDIVLDVDNKSITHRPDLWSHFGFARELAGIYKKPVKFDPKTTPAPRSVPLPQKKIKIEKDAALSYFGLMCDNVQVSATPLWMKARLAAVGQKSINNIVDASNYVMLELGQPNHAFDARTLKSDSITVAQNGRNGVKVARLKMLDETEVAVPEDTILVIDGGSGGRPVALAGVMGGLDSAIAPDSTQVFLESATFPRESIRRTLAKLQMRTDSAVRFEKGQDPYNAKPALFRIVSLLKETCPEIRAGKVTGSAPVPARRNKIPVPLELLQKRLGFDITAAETKAILSRMHFDVIPKKTKSGTMLTVTAPTFRSQYDITIPEDIVEEIGRVHGYDNIAPVAPPVPCDSVMLNHERIFEREAREFLIHNGRFFET